MEDMRRKKNPAKAQSAMEYLMTYGWAILIIAVVLGALFQLGVFNAGTFSPRAPPGACQVFRPNGPGTSSLINLEGVCSGELPQYVGSFTTNPNGVTVQFASILESAHPFSISWWFSSNLPSSTNFDWEMVSGDQPNVTALDMQLCGSGASCGIGGSGTGLHGDICADSSATCYDSVDYGFTFSSGVWYNVVLVFIDSGYSIYLNGVNESHVGYSFTPYLIGSGDTLQIGSGRGITFNGLIASVQAYNTSLSSNEILYLYDEGIGGAPIKLDNLVGWWPLNGNANDYSGNNNNGVPTGATYTNQWTSGYTAP